VVQRAGLQADRWRSFSHARQILQIAAEMHRATSFVESNRSEHVQAGYERLFRLVALTAQGNFVGMGGPAPEVQATPPFPD
jgi:hypothetical protein